MDFTVFTDSTLFFRKFLREKKSTILKSNYSKETYWHGKQKFLDKRWKHVSTTVCVAGIMSNNNEFLAVFLDTFSCCFCSNECFCFLLFRYNMWQFSNFQNVVVQCDFIWIYQTSRWHDINEKEISLLPEETLWWAVS